MLPKGVGHVRVGGEKHLIHSGDGPTATIRWPGEKPQGPGGILVHVYGAHLRPAHAWQVAPAGQIAPATCDIPSRSPAQASDA